KKGKAPPPLTYPTLAGRGSEFGGSSRNVRVSGRFRRPEPAEKPFTPTLSTPARRRSSGAARTSDCLPILRRRTHPIALAVTRRTSGRGPPSHPVSCSGLRTIPPVSTQRRQPWQTLIRLLHPNRNPPCSFPTSSPRWSLQRRNRLLPCMVAVAGHQAESSGNPEWW